MTHTIELAREGCEALMTPVQACYLDMVRADAWQQPGDSWAGTAPQAYACEVDFPDELKHRMKGIQARIWQENFVYRDHFNRLVFPRLSAVACLPLPRRHGR